MKANRICKTRPKVKSTSRKDLLVSIGLVSMLRRGPANREKVALLAGYGSHKSPAFRCALGRLEKDGQLQDLRSNKNLVMLTEKGCRDAIAYAASSALPSSNKEVHETILPELSPKMTLLFHLLEDGQSYSRDYLSKQLGYATAKEGGFQSLLSRMHCKGYLDLGDSSSVLLGTRRKYFSLQTFRQ